MISEIGKQGFINKLLAKKIQLTANEIKRSDKSGGAVELSRDNMLLMQLQLEMTSTIENFEFESVSSISEDALSEKGLILTDSFSGKVNVSYSNTSTSAIEGLHAGKFSFMEKDRDTGLIGWTFHYPHELLMQCNICLGQFWAENFLDLEEISWKEFEAKLRVFLTIGAKRISEIEVDFLLNMEHLQYFKETIDFYRQDIVSIYSLCIIMSSVNIFETFRAPKEASNFDNSIHNSSVRLLPLRYLVFLLSRGLRGSRVVLPLLNQPLPTKDIDKCEGLSLRELAVTYSAHYLKFLKGESSTMCGLQLFRNSEYGLVDDGILLEKLVQTLMPPQDVNPSDGGETMRTTVLWGERLTGKTTRALAAVRHALYRTQSESSGQSFEPLDALYIDLKDKTDRNQILSCFSHHLCLGGGNLPFRSRFSLEESFLRSTDSPNVEGCLLNLLASLRRYSIVVLDHVEPVAGAYMSVLFNELRRSLPTKLVFLVVLNTNDVAVLNKFVETNKLGLCRSASTIEVPPLDITLTEELTYQLLLRRCMDRQPSSKDFSANEYGLSDSQSTEDYLLSVALKLLPERGTTLTKEEFESDKWNNQSIISELHTLSRGQPGLIGLLLRQSITTFRQLAHLHKQKASLLSSEVHTLTLESLFFDCGTLVADEKLLIHCLSPLLYRAYCTPVTCDVVVFSQDMAWQLSESYFDLTGADQDEQSHAHSRFIVAWERLIYLGVLRAFTSWPLPLPESSQVVRFSAISANSTTAQILSEKRLLKFTSQFPFFCDLTGCGYPSKPGAQMCRFEFGTQLRRYLSIIVRIFGTTNDLLYGLNHLGRVPELLQASSLISCKQRQILRHVDSALLSHFEYVLLLLIQQLSSALRERGFTPQGKGSNSDDAFIHHQVSGDSMLRLFPPISPVPQYPRKREYSRSSDACSEDEIDYQETYLDSSRNDQQLLRIRPANMGVKTPANKLTQREGSHQSTGCDLQSQESKFSSQLMPGDFSMISVAEIFQLVNLLAGHFSTLAVKRLHQENVIHPYCKLITEIAAHRIVECYRKTLNSTLRISWKSLDSLGKLVMDATSLQVAVSEFASPSSSFLALQNANALLQAMSNLVVISERNESSQFLDKLSCVCADGCSVCASRSSGLLSSLSIISSPDFVENNEFVKGEDGENQTQRMKFRTNLKLQCILGQVMTLQLLQKSDSTSITDTYLTPEVLLPSRETVEEFHRNLIREAEQGVEIRDASQTTAELLEDLLTFKELHSGTFSSASEQLQKMYSKVDDIDEAAFICNVQTSLATLMFDNIVRLRLKNQPDHLPSVFLRSVEALKQLFVPISNVKLNCSVGDVSAAGTLTRFSVRASAVRGSAVNVHVLCGYQDNVGLFASDECTDMALAWTSTPGSWQPFCWGPWEKWTVDATEKSAAEDSYGRIIQLFDSAVTELLRLFGNNSLLAADAIVTRGRVRHFFGSFDAALSDYQESLRIYRVHSFSSRPSGNLPLIALFGAGTILSQLQEKQELCIVIFDECLALSHRMNIPEHFICKMSRWALILQSLAQKRFNRAIDLIRGRVAVGQHLADEAMVRLKQWTRTSDPLYASAFQEWMQAQLRLLHQIVFLAVLLSLSNNFLEAGIFYQKALTELRRLQQMQEGLRAMRSKSSCPAEHVTLRELVHLSEADILCMYASCIYREGCSLYAGLKYRPRNKGCVDVHFESAMEIMDHVSELYTTAEVRIAGSRLLQCYRLKISMRMQQQEMDEAVRLNKKLLDLFTKSSDFDYEDIAASFYAYGNLLCCSEDWFTAALLYQQAADIFRSSLLLQLDADPAADRRSRRHRGDFQLRLVSPLGLDSQDEFGSVFEDFGITVSDGALVEVPSELAWEIALAGCLLKKAICQIELQRHDLAQLTATEALNLYRKIIPSPPLKNSPLQSVRGPWWVRRQGGWLGAGVHNGVAASLCCLGQVHHHFDEHRQAATHYTEAASIFTQHAVRVGEERILKKDSLNLASVYNNLATLFDDMVGNLFSSRIGVFKSILAVSQVCDLQQDAKSMYEQAVVILLRSHSSTAQAQIFRTLENLLVLLGAMGLRQEYASLEKDIESMAGRVALAAKEDERTARGIESSCGIPLSLRAAQSVDDSASLHSGEDETDEVHAQELQLERGDCNDTDSPSSAVILSASSNEKIDSITDEVKEFDNDQLSESEDNPTSEETTYCAVS